MKLVIKYFFKGLPRVLFVWWLVDGFIDLPRDIKNFSSRGNIEIIVNTVLIVILTIITFLYICQIGKEICNSEEHNDKL